MNTFVTSNEIRQKIFELDIRMKNKDIVEFYNYEDTALPDFTYPTLKYRQKEDGTLRKIYVYPLVQRINQKIVLERLIKEYGHLISRNVYSYKKGISIRKPIKKVQHLMQQDGFYGISFDIADYFGSVRYDIMCEVIDKYIKEDDVKIYLKKLVSIDGYYHNDTLIKMEPNMQAGSPVSAFMANLLLKDIDEKYERQIQYYSRYADDLLILDTDEEKVRAIYESIKEDLAKLGLEIKEPKTKYIQKGESIEYLGCIISNNIDLKKSKWKKRRLEIKSICNRYRKELSKNRQNMTQQDKDEVIEKLIKRINKYLYANTREDLQNGVDHSNATFIFTTVTNIQSIIDFDIFIKDTIRATITGKHNKANARISNKYLANRGYMSLMTARKLSKEYNSLYKSFLEVISKQT